MEKQIESQDRKNFMTPQFENTLEKREQFAVSLRKKKTQDAVMAKRRKIVDQLSSKKQNQGEIIEFKDDIELTIEEMENELYKGYPPWRKTKYEELNQILERLISVDIDENQTSTGKISELISLLMGRDLQQIEMLAIVTQIRKEFSMKNHVPDSERAVKETGLMKMISQILFLDQDQYPLYRYLQLEATWILSNLCNAEESTIIHVLDPQYNILQNLNKMLQSNDLQMIDQIVSIFANIAGESLKFRNLILTQTDIVDGLCRIISEGGQANASLRKGMLLNIIWCTCNLVRHKCRQENLNQANQNNNQFQQNLIIQDVSIQEKQKILYIVCPFLTHKEMEDFRNEALIALADMLENTDDQFIDHVVQNQTVLKILIQTLTNESVGKRQSTYRCIGNILSTANHQNVDQLLNLNVISELFDALKMLNDQKMKKDLLWAMSNITAGSENQIREFISDQSRLKIIFDLMENVDQQIVREATYVITNLIYTVTNQVQNGQEVVYHVVSCHEFHFFRAIVNALKVDDQGFLMEILQSLRIVFILDSKLGLTDANSMTYKFEVEGGFDILERLQNHPARQIYEEVEYIITNFLESDDNGFEVDHRYNSQIQMTSNAGFMPNRSNTTVSTSTADTSNINFQI